MKKVISVLPFLFIMSLLACVLVSCEKDEEDEKCEETKRNLISRSFHFDIYVTHAGSNEPYQGNMLFAVKKTYCNGSTSGNYGESGTTDNTGYWNVPVSYTYDFANSLDRVTATFVAATGEGSHSVTAVFTYEDVAQQHFGIEKTMTLVVPWDAK